MEKLDSSNLPDWGNDDLSRFLCDAEYNTIANSKNFQKQFNLLKQINNAFKKITGNLDRIPSLLPAFLLFRSHSSFLAAIRVSLGGQISETFMLLRGCLESSMYAYFINNNDPLQELWLSRHDDEDSMKKVRREFQIRKILDYIQSKNTKLAENIEKLYNITIDYGAHPNERSITSSIKSEKQENTEKFNFEYFTQTNLMRKGILKICADIGICSLEIFRQIFMHRFAILFVSEDLINIKSLHNKIIKTLP